VKESTLSLWLGAALWTFVMATYGIGLMTKGRAGAATSFLYNAPVAFLFSVLCVYLLLQVGRLGVFDFGRSYGGTVLVWFAGLCVLYLRLVSRSLEVSGHLAWLPMLTLQAWLLGFPIWLVATGGGATLLAAYMKFAVFRGPSGVPGLITGALLAGSLFLLQRRRVVKS